MSGKHALKLNTHTSKSPVQGIIYIQSRQNHLIQYHFDASFTVFTEVIMRSGQVGFFMSHYMIPYNMDDPNVMISGVVPPKFPFIEDTHNGT